MIKYRESNSGDYVRILDECERKAKVENTRRPRMWYQQPIYDQKVHLRSVKMEPDFSGYRSPDGSHPGR